MENWAESWFLEKRLDPNWRDRLVLLRLAKAQRLTREPILVKLPVALLKSKRNRNIRPKFGFGLAETELHFFNFGFGLAETETSS